MKELLIKLKIIDFLTTQLPISRHEFVDKLYSITDEGSTGFFGGPFEAFSSGGNEFKGHVDFDGFKLRRRRHMLDRNINMAVATGTITDSDGQVTVTTEISGFNNFMFLFYVLLLIIYSFFILAFFISDHQGDSFSPLFLVIHGTFMFSVPYFIMRRSVKQLKYDLEREFFYLTKRD